MICCLNVRTFTANHCVITCTTGRAPDVEKPASVMFKVLLRTYPELDETGA